MPERPPRETAFSVYSNFDHALDATVVKELEANPDLYAQHSGWNFCGSVWCRDGVWFEEVWHYGTVVATYEGDSPLVVINETNNNHGRE